MYYLCFMRNVKLYNVGKSRLYSSCFYMNNFLNDSQTRNRISLIRNDVQKRQFSLQSTVESIIKTQSGIFRSLSESVPVSYAQDFVLNVHASTGLPWWASIILTTVILRSLVTVPLAIYQNYIFAKVENLHQEMPAIITELKRETTIAIRKFKWDERTAKIAFNRSLKKQWQNLIVRENCHPFKASILLWAQLPMWICLSISFRNLVYMLPKSDIDAQVTLTELTVGGIGWIPNLVMPDFTLILPVTLGLVNLLIIEIQAASKSRAPTKLQRYATNFFRGLTVLMIPISASVPSCLALYWVSSSIYGLGQNLILMSPKVKRFAGVPKTATELQNPYLHVAMKLKDRFSFKKNVETS